MSEDVKPDSWFKRRMMRMTRFEKQAVNSPEHARHTEQTALALLEHASLPPRPRCLEVGCGQGALARLLVERYDARLIASDYDPAQVALAQAHLADLDGRIEFRVVDARAMPFEDGQFDAVFAFGIMHHIPGGWRRVVAEVARVLEPGGWFLLTDFCLHSRTGCLFDHLLPRLGQLEETALHDCLVEHGLYLTHEDHGRSIAAGLMRYCMGVAHKQSNVTLSR